MKTGKTLAGIALAAGAILMAGMPRVAGAQTLGWNSYLTAQCVANTNCTVVLFTQALTGLKPLDNQGNVVPNAILAIGSPGFIESFSIRSLGGSPHFVSATVLNATTGWRTKINTVGGVKVLETNQDGITPWDAAPVMVQATFDASAFNEDFSSSGTAHLDGYSDYFTVVAGTATINPAGTGYNLGTFNNNGETFIAQTVAPEPGSMTLLFTGFAGLAGVVRRRRRAQA